MGTTSFDIGGLMGAAARYDEASARAAQARQCLAGASVDAGALGGTPASRALGSALLGFHTAQTTAAEATANALGGFAQRTYGVAALGDEGIAATTHAAGG